MPHQSICQSPAPVPPLLLSKIPKILKLLSISGQTLYSFLDENHSLRLQGGNSHSCLFSLRCKLLHSELEVIAWRSEKNHIIRKKQKDDPKATKPELSISILIPLLLNNGSIKRTDWLFFLILIWHWHLNVRQMTHNHWPVICYNKKFLVY